MATKRIGKYDWIEMKDGYYLPLPSNTSYPLLTVYLREVKLPTGGVKWNARINDVAGTWKGKTPTTVEQAAALVMSKVEKLAQKMMSDLGLHLLDAEKTMQIVAETCSHQDSIAHKWVGDKCKLCDQPMDSRLIARINKRLRKLAYEGEG